MVRSLLFARLGPQFIASRMAQSASIRLQAFSTQLKDPITVSHTKAPKETESKPEEEKMLKSSCGDVDRNDDDEMEQEEMFVDAHDSFQFKGKEHGGPRRGGRLPEPTRFGDWERKGRCTDF